MSIYGNDFLFERSSWKIDECQTASQSALSPMLSGSQNSEEPSTLFPLFLAVCGVACAIWWRTPVSKPSRVRKAFSVDKRDGILTDHGTVRARLWIHPKTHAVTNSPTSHSCLAFDIWYGSGASLFGAEKGINDAWRYLSGDKMRDISRAFSADAIVAYNALWMTIYQGLAPPQFDPLAPRTHKHVYKELVDFININALLAPAPDSAIVKSALDTYIATLVELTRNHLGDAKAYEVQQRVNGERRWYTPPDVEEESFHAVCTRRIYNKPAILLRDFSTIIGFAPQGGFVIDPSSPYLTREGAADAINTYIPPAGEGVLALAEGLDPSQLGVSRGMIAYADDTEKNDPCSVHWKQPSYADVTAAVAPQPATCQVVDCTIKWVGDELTDALIADGATHSRENLLMAIKDTYVIRLKVQLGPTPEEQVDIRFANVHFCSSGSTDARTVAVPAILQLASLYELHAVGGDTNVTESKEPNKRTVAYVKSSIEHLEPAAKVETFPHPISKTRPAGDMLINAQFLTKYGELIERDGMIAIAF